MNDLLGAVKDTPLPSILVFAGIVFWILAVAGSLAGKITVQPDRQKAAGLVGTVFIAVGLLIYFVPTQMGQKQAAPNVQDCLQGYVWRETYRDDHVCVSIETHMRTIQDNELAESRRNPAGGAYGADSCKAGFVWRDAFPGDHVCVLVETRTEAAEDNQQGPLRVKR
jgi:hypothetical protein